MRETKETRLQLKAIVLAAVTMIAVVMMMGMMTIISHAEEGRVTASSVKIRESADTGSEMLSGALQGDILPITGEVTGADGKVWYQVTFEGNRTGYIRSDLMEKVSSSTSNTSTPVSGVIAVSPVSAKVSGEQVRVRSDASTSGSIVTTVQKDVVLTITGTASDSEGKTWYQVSFNDANGQVTGFVRQDFVTVEGEIVPVDQTATEPENPVVDEPAESETPVAEPETAHKDFETQLNEDGWYLLDYTNGEMYSIADLFEVPEKYKEMYEESQAKLKSMKTIMIVLVFVVILLALAATLLFFKIRDMMDAAYFEEVEKETIRNRQSQRGANRASMPTVGPSHKASAGGQQKPAGSGQQKPAGSGQQKPAGGGQQTRSGNGQNKAAGSGQQRPAGNSQQRPAGANQQKPAAGNQQRPAGNSQQKSVGAGQQSQTAAKPVQQAAKPTQQPKNFAADDDEFEFEFLNWDGEEDN